ncbi:transposable element Tcb2 transposase [Trichonephila clavipes]|nr:transposable element Tcb2 transposase [Trichonephila clavipes]
MVLKAKDNDWRKNHALSRDEFRGPLSDVTVHQQLKSHRVAASARNANNQSVRRHLDALLLEVESLGEVGGRPQCDKCGCRVRNCSQHRFTTLETISNYRNSYPGFSSGRPRRTTPADNQYIVLQAKRNRRQTAGESLDTRHRRLDDLYRVLQWPEDCTVVVCLHDALYDESRFSLSSDSHRILIWRERGSHNHPSSIIERDRGAMGLQFLFMDDNAPCHCTVAAKQLLESRRLVARTLPPVTIRELRLAQQDEWAAMPQQLIDTLILSMGRRCETCLAVRGDRIPY